MICLDYFELGHHSYLVCADRFSGWLIIFLFPGKASAPSLINTCRNLFTVYGVCEKLTSDGEPQFISSNFQDFLKAWGVKHDPSSVSYPQSNGRAEVAVKTAKRIIGDNTSSNGSLNNDKVARAILQYRSLANSRAWPEPIPTTFPQTIEGRHTSKSKVIQAA